VLKLTNQDLKMFKKSEDYYQLSPSDDENDFFDYLINDAIGNKATIVWKDESTPPVYTPDLTDEKKHDTFRLACLEHAILVWEDKETEKEKDSVESAAASFESLSISR